MLLEVHQARCDMVEIWVQLPSDICMSQGVSDPAYVTYNNYRHCAHCRTTKEGAEKAKQTAQQDADQAAQEATAKADEAKQSADDEIEEMLAELKRKSSQKSW